jgi:hypothetical protein
MLSLFRKKTNTKKSEDIIRLNIRGTIFETRIQTLVSEKESLFLGLFINGINLQTQEEYFFDRPPKYFDIILSHLQGCDVSRTVSSLSEEEKYSLAQEVDYFNIQSMLPMFPRLQEAQNPKMFVIAFEKLLAIWNMNDPATCHVIAHVTVDSIVYLRDEKAVLCGLEDGSIAMFDLYTKQRLRSWSRYEEEYDLYRNRVSVVDKESANMREIVIWSFNSQSALHVINEGVGYLQDLAIMNNSIIYSGESYFGSYFLKIFDMKTGVLSVVNVAKCQASLLRWDDTTFISAGSDSITVWKTRENEHVILTNGIVERLFRLDDHLVVLIANDTIEEYKLQIYSMSSYKKLITYEYEDDLQCIAVAASTVVSFFTNQTVHILDFARSILTQERDIKMPKVRTAVYQDKTI